MKKKSFRDIRNAVVMLCVMLAMLSTATFAWFSMSNKVNAEGMMIKAKADSSLLIKAGIYDAAEIQAAPESPAIAEVAEAELYPAAHNSLSSSTDAGNVANWYYMIADAPNASASTKDAIALNSFEGYALVNSFSITTSKGSSMSDLVAQATITKAGGADAVKVLIAGPDGVQEFEGDSSEIGSGILANSVTSDEAVQVDVYVYWDGNDEDVFTTNVANLQETTVTIQFSATPGGGAVTQ